jgi:hypothetical protein
MGLHLAHLLPHTLAWISAPQALIPLDIPWQMESRLCVNVSPNITKSGTFWLTHFDLTIVEELCSRLYIGLLVVYHASLLDRSRKPFNLVQLS